MTHNIKLNRIFDILGRMYMYFKLGYTNYIAVVLGITAYFTIIYNFLLYKYLPTTNADAFILFMVAFTVISIIIGVAVKKSGFWGKEHQIGMEANPGLNFPIGAKELLSYDATILGYEGSKIGYETSIILLKNQIKMNEKLGIDASELKLTIEKQEIMLEKTIGMQQKMIAMRAKGKTTT